MKLDDQSRKDISYDDMIQHDHQILIANTKIEDIVTKISKDPLDFLKFVYELRKADV